MTRILKLAPAPDEATKTNRTEATPAAVAEKKTKKAKAAAPKTVKEALQRSLKLVAQGGSQSGQARRRKAS